MATTSPRAISKATWSRMTSGPEGSATRLPRPSTPRAGVDPGTTAARGATGAAGSAAAWGAGASAMFIRVWLSWTAGTMRTTEMSFDATARDTGQAILPAARQVAHRRPAARGGRHPRPVPGDDADSHQHSLCGRSRPDAMGHRFTAAAGTAACTRAGAGASQRGVAAHGAGDGRLALGRLRHGRARRLGVAAGRAAGARAARLAGGERQHQRRDYGRRLVAHRPRGAAPPAGRGRHRAGGQRWPARAALA